jgi:uncharacterized iron-regulated membrane protein
MIRLLFLFHRYLGIGVGVLMTMWCLSGVVMMYVSYPWLTPQTRVAHLPPIDWRDCCRVSSAMLGDTESVSRFGIEMLAGRPVLNSQSIGEKAQLIDLSTGAAIDGISPEQAGQVAATYEPATGEAGAPRLLGRIDFDQWTLEGVPPQERPLYRFDLRDKNGGELYISSVTGRAVQFTTRRERFWNWLGAVPHWLYFADLRHRVGLWSQIVIYTSLTGCFLALTGLYLGVRQLLRRPAGRWSPYRGYSLWHHIAGVIFGVFLLTWVMSGMLSMNPWGLMEGGESGPERAALRGAPITGGELRAALQALAASAPAGVVSIQSVPFAGRLFLLACDRDGSRRRLNAAGEPAPLSPAEWGFIAATLHGSAQAMQLLGRGDDYYFGFAGDSVELPVWRVLPGDGTDRRYYIDPVSGALVMAMDRGSERYRWWFDGLHRLDFVAVMRTRPQWDVLMWLLLAGVTMIAATGTYAAYRRLAR